jgi:hypothetical protein
VPGTLSKPTCQCTLLNLGSLAAVRHCSSHKLATVPTSLRFMEWVHLVDFYDRGTLFAETLVNSAIHPPLEFEVHVRPVHPR